MNYADGKTSFLETVKEIESNGVKDSVLFELSGHPFPCESMFARIESEKRNGSNTSFHVTIEYELKPGISEIDASNFGKGIQGLVSGMAINAKTLFEKKEEGK